MKPMMIVEIFRDGLNHALQLLRVVRKQTDIINISHMANTPSPNELINIDHNTFGKYRACITPDRYALRSARIDGVNSAFYVLSNIAEPRTSRVY